MGKNKEKKKAGFFKKLIRLIIIIILIPVLLAGGLYVNYLFTKEKPEDYLSSDFMLYLEIESMGQVYENLVDLKALEVFLTGQQKNDLFLALNNFKSGNLARHPLFKDILDIKAYLQILDNGKPVIILDPGVRKASRSHLPPPDWGWTHQL